MKKLIYSLSILFGIVMMVILLKTVNFEHKNEIRLNNENNKFLVMCHEGKKPANASDEDFKKICKYAERNKNFKTSFFSEIYTCFGETSYYNLIYLFVLILICSIWCSRYFTSGMLKNDLNRMSYGQILKKLFLNTYKPAIVLPIFVFIGIFIVYFTFPNLMPTGEIDVVDAFYGNLWLFVFAFLSRHIFLILFYLNIILIMLRYFHKYVLLVISSFLSILFIEGFSHIFIVGLVFGETLKYDKFSNLFNMINFLLPNFDTTVLGPILVPFIYLIISYLILCFKYRNKEKLVLSLEEEK